MRALDLRLELLSVTPVVWRTLRVPADLRLDDLHRAIQIVMGWDDYHLHVFEVGDREYGPRPEDVDDDEDLPATWAGEDSSVTIAAAFSQADGGIAYEYDFGDEWRLAIAVTGEAEAAGAPRIECTGGELAGPPEDAGGVNAYQEILDSWLKTGKRGLSQEIRDRLRRGFDPTQFSVGAANAALREEFRPTATPDRPAGQNASAEQQMLAHLTLLVLFLGSHETRDGRHEAWKNVRFEILDTLQEAGLIVTTPHRKAVVITDVGVEQAEQLAERVAPILAEFTRQSTGGA